ncbi:hypothetical protein DENSPDRAFT_295552 [Dentipellis sp. KUC8613]|nr:hypothetical protein DENSPDRAFT_295552 [Dentipellis sp. KUC8613]
MSLIPTLNADCTSIILGYLDNSALSAFALTSHAAVVPVRKELARCLHFTDVESAITGFTFLQNHSLECSVRAIVLDIPEEKWSSSFTSFVTDILTSTRNLTRVLIKKYAELANAEPRIAEILTSGIFTIVHLHLHGLRRTSLEPLLDIRGLRSVAFGVQDNYCKIECAKHIIAIVSGNAATLQDVSIDGPSHRMWLRLEAHISPCLLVSRLTLHNLAFFYEEIGRVFPNIHQQHLWRTNIYSLEEEGRLGPHGPPLARELMLPVQWYHDFLSLRSLVIQSTNIAFHVDDLTASLRQSSLRDLSLSHVSIGKPRKWSPPSDIGIAACPLLSDIVSSAYSLRRLDMGFKFNIPYDPVCLPAFWSLPQQRLTIEFSGTRTPTRDLPSP